MHKVRVRIWATGALIATERDPNTGVTRVLEFDGRDRYHAVSIQGHEWNETELRVDRKPPRARAPSF